MVRSGHCTGFFLTEEVLFSDRGEQLTLGAWEYKPPAVHDIPLEFNIRFERKVPNPSPVAVLGSKASGEPPMALGAAVARRAACVSVTFCLVITQARGATLRKLARPRESGWTAEAEVTSTFPIRPRGQRCGHVVRSSGLGSRGAVALCGPPRAAGGAFRSQCATASTS